jgi:hypothetical protein
MFVVYTLLNGVWGESCYRTNYSYVSFTPTYLKLVRFSIFLTYSSDETLYYGVSRDLWMCIKIIKRDRFISDKRSRIPEYELIPINRLKTY